MNRQHGWAAFASVLFLASTAFAAEAPPAALVKARTDFAAAVAAKDLKAAKALTSFPLKNTVFSAPPSISEAGFAKQFKTYQEMADCLKSEKLEPPAGGGRGPKSWTVNCNGNVFHFAVKDGRWLHSEYENINE